MQSVSDNDIRKRLLEKPRSDLTTKGLLLLVHGLGPAYLADDCRYVTGGRRGLRSSTDTHLLLTPRASTTFGDRAFSAAGPRVWNALPVVLRDPALNVQTFSGLLKMYLFV